MKRLFLVCLLVLLFSSPVLAAPFLICAPDTSTNQPTYYTVAFDGGTAVQSNAYAVTGGVEVHYDLSALANGSHTVNVQACNIWGCSVAVPFSFTKSIPATDTGLAISQT